MALREGSRGRTAKRLMAGPMGEGSGVLGYSTVAFNALLEEKKIIGNISRFYQEKFLVDLIQTCKQIKKI